MKPIPILLLAAALPCSAQTNHALGKPVTADSVRAGYPAANAVDGVLGDPSRWLADAAAGGHWLEIDLGTSTTLRQAHIYSGYQNEAGSPINSFSLQRWNGTAWQPIPGAAIEPNRSMGIVFQFDAPVLTTKVRLVVADTTIIRVREVALWENPTPLFTGMTGDNLPVWHPTYANLALGKPATAHASVNSGSANFAVDGEASDNSRLVAQPPSSPAGPLHVEVDLTFPLTVAEAHVHSGAASGSADAAFHLESEHDGVWTTIPGSVVTGNTNQAVRVTFNAPVTTRRIRYVPDGLGASGFSRLRELTLWESTQVPLNLGLFVGGPTVLNPTTPVALNQIGFQNGAPKRFTAINCPDGTPFHITLSTAVEPLFSGTVQGNLGDLSGFEPSAPGPYVVRVEPAGNAPGTSDPFLILDDLIGTKYLPPAIHFMNDARSVIGTHPSAFGGAPWRDGTYYSFEIPSLVHLLLTRRDVVVALPREIDWEAEKATILSPAFDGIYKELTASAGFLPAIRRYYQNYDAPRSNAPDLVKILHFGMGVTLERPATKDWSGDERPEQIHSQTVEWAAWILYAWPVLREWLPQSFYDKVRDFAFAEWGKSSGMGTTTRADDDPSSLEIDPLWHASTYGTVDKSPFKGRHAPAHSIWPNLLMYQVALREGRPDAPIYLQAAKTQTQWLIDNLDWNDPRTTKGHRMSENKTMPGLVYFLRTYPTEAPSGLAAKIEQWADIMIARSANGYDFRRYDTTDWSIPAASQKWNEPGNLAGFPACALAAASTLGHAPAKQQRLRQISWAAIDCLFGRNPLRAASPGRPVTLADGKPGGFPDVERGWPQLYTGQAAYLESARGALCSGPGSEHFPNNPDAALRHPEPWTNFNAAWNLSLAYMAADLDGTQDTHRIPLAYTGPADGDLDNDRIPDLIHHASTGLHRTFQDPVLLTGPTLEVLHNLQAYDAELTVEWTTSLRADGWHPATFSEAGDIPHNDGTLTRRWDLPAGEPKLFYRLRATR
ncbi:discoidin domain-containing protein [Luteolibacter sp. SL250]|uniref:discoidin domain-containing protein n=1 Tax=Luteolibacter sp. SL250 TaxID=2995170 RepID=UPI002270F0A4|nr:discoidin domain-containing protein [Luteolibacter sp. SL250]WAC19601.1 discoidin domain-containing protein [Luteolibacter sp. SL250]